MEGLIYFVMFCLILLGVINFIITLSISLVLVKVFEIVKNQEERVLMADAAKKRARGLIDIDTTQFSH